MDKLLPGSIDKEHIRVLEQIVDERLAGIPLEKLLIYIIETCDPQALPYLAKQFNVLGNRGWRWADTEQKKRDLLKRAIKMQRKEGTEFAVKESLKVIGIDTAQILHPIPGNTYNGQWSFNGSITYGGAYHWASFKVLIDADELSTLPPETLQIAVELINEWKNVRSLLVAIEAAIDIEDSVDVTDELMFEGDLNIVDQVGPYTYDGSIDYNGDENYDQTYDEFVLNLPVDLTLAFAFGWPDGVNELITIDIPFVSPMAYRLQTPGGVLIDGNGAGILLEDFSLVTSGGSGAIRVFVEDLANIKAVAVDSPSIIDFSIVDTLEGLEEIQVVNGSINAVTLSPTPLLTQALFNGNNISSDIVNDILAWVLSNGVSNGILNLSGQTPPAPPTGQGVADKNELILTYNWTLPTD